MCPIDPSIALQIKPPTIAQPDIGSSLINAYKLKSAQLDVAKQQNEEEYKLLASATPDNYGQIRQIAVQKYGPQADQQLPPVYDKAAIDNLTMSRLDIKDKLSLAQKQYEMQMEANKFDETKRHDQATEGNASARTAAMYPQIPGLESLGYGGISSGQLPSAPAPSATIGAQPLVTSTNLNLPTGTLAPPSMTGTGGVSPSPTSSLLPPPQGVVGPSAPNPQAPVSGTAPQVTSGTPPAMLQGKPLLDHIKQVNPGLGNMMEAIGNGDQPLPPPTIRGRPNPLAEAVNQVYPGISTSTFQARNKATQDFFGGGKSQQAVNALNTAIGHAGELLDKINALHQSDTLDSPLTNPIANYISKKSGKPEVTNFEAVVPNLAHEIVRLYSGAGGALADVQKQEQTIGDVNASKTQQLQALNEMSNLLKSKILSFQNQYNTSMSGAPNPRPFNALSPESEGVISKISGHAAPKTTVAHNDIDAELAKRGVK